MKKCSKLKKGIVVIGSLIFMNQVLMPVCSSPSLTIFNKYLFRPKKTLVDKNTNCENKIYKKYEGALDYLLKANYYVHQNSESHFDCKHFTAKTYHTYQDLIRKTCREDLKNKVRLVVGMFEEPDIGMVGHIWIQYRDEKNVIRNFETTTPTHIKTEKMDYELKRLYQDYKENEKQQIAIHQYSIWGSTFFYPTIDEFLFPGGAARKIYKGIEYLLKKD